jgi:hypothetical protein
MALERFIPKSPDMFIRNSQDFEVAKFGHLNTIVEYINNNSAKPAGLNGYVQFNDNSALGGDAGLFWDNVNKRLGVGTVTPGAVLEIYGGTETLGISGPANQAKSIQIARYNNSSFQAHYIGDDGGAFFGAGLTISASGSNSQIYLQVSSPGRNVNIGSAGQALLPKDLGARLGVRGSGSTSATTALLIQNSTGTNSFEVKDDRNAILSGGLTTTGILSFADVSIQAGLKVLTTAGIGGYNAAKDGTKVDIYGSQTTASSFGGAQSLWINNTLLANNNNYNLIGLRINPTFDHSTFVNTVDYGIQFNSTFAFSTGTNNSTNFILNPTYNYTGGTNTVRGIYYNPTLTSLVNTTHRAIETTTGDVLLATTSGNVGIGTSAPTSKLYLDGGIFTKKYYTDTANQTINFGSAYELFGTPHASSGYSFFINPTGFSSGWDVNIGNATTYFNFNGSNGFSAFKISALSLTLGGGQLSYYLSSPDTGWSYASAGGWDFVIRGSADEKLRIKSGGNVLIGTSTDLGGKLSIKGSGSTSGTTSLLVQNSLGTNSLSITDDGVATFFKKVQLQTSGVNEIVLTPNDGSNVPTLTVYNVTFGGKIDLGYGSIGVGGGEMTIATNAQNININSAWTLKLNPSRGVRMPRLTTLQRLAITSPDNGLVVFDTDVQNLCYRRDGVWVQATYAAV